MSNIFTVRKKFYKNNTQRGSNPILTSLYNIKRDENNNTYYDFCLEDFYTAIASDICNYMKVRASMSCYGFDSSVMPDEESILSCLRSQQNIIINSIFGYQFKYVYDNDTVCLSFDNNIIDICAYQRCIIDSDDASFICVNNYADAYGNNIIRFSEKPFATQNEAVAQFLLYRDKSPSVICTPSVIVCDSNLRSETWFTANMQIIDTMNKHPYIDFTQAFRISPDEHLKAVNELINSEDEIKNRVQKHIRIRKYDHSDLVLSLGLDMNDRFQAFTISTSPFLNSSRTVLMPPFCAFVLSDNVDKFRRYDLGDVYKNEEFNIIFTRMDNNRSITLFQFDSEKLKEMDPDGYTDYLCAYESCINYIVTNRTNY